MPHPIERFRSLALAAGALATLTLATGAGDAAPAQVQAISASDKAQGAKAHPQFVAEFGGAVTGRQADYVEAVGKNIAVQSGLSNARGDFTVTLLNSPINNAFAVPGGYVYVTRQLVSLMNNEAELAGVLGHEVGHVAARHSAQRQKAATRNSILGVLGSVLSGVLLGDSQFSQVVQRGFLQGSQLLTLKYSRSQETEADTLGIRYLKSAGYDPRAMSTVLASLARQNALDARLMGSKLAVPEWASTHPDPASRVRAALAQAGSDPHGITNRDTFLTRVDGLVYGDDPEQGVVDGRMFTHPGLRLHFEAPPGYYLVNGTQAVAIEGQTGKGQFASGRFDGDLDAYVGHVFAGLTGQGEGQIVPGRIDHVTIGGLPAARATVRTNSGNGPVDVTVVAYRWSATQAFHFVTIAQAGGSGVFEPMFASLRHISEADAKAVRPRHLQVVKVGRGDTLRSLAARMAYTDAQLDRFLVLNGLDSNAQLMPGQLVKLVVH